MYGWSGGGGGGGQNLHIPTENGTSVLHVLIILLFSN